MPTWNQIIADLHDFDETDKAVAACKALDQASDRSKLPDLYQLLRDGSNFFIREAAAEPIVRLDGLAALPDLLTARQRGKEERHDNDGLDAVIYDLVTLNPREATLCLLEIVRNPTDNRRADAANLLGLAASLPPDTGVAGPTERDCILEALVGALADTDEEVRESAAAALANFDDRAVVPALENALRDPAKSVRKAAKGSLENLKGASRTARQWISDFGWTLPDPTDDNLRDLDKVMDHDQFWEWSGGKVDMKPHGRGWLSSLVISLYPRVPG